VEGYFDIVQIAKQKSRHILILNYIPSTTSLGNPFYKGSILLNTLFAIPSLLCLLIFSPGISLAFTAEKLNLILYDQLEQFTADFSDSPNKNRLHNMHRWLSIVYGQTGLQPLWVNMDGPADKAATLLAIIQNANMDGLDPEQYYLSQLTSLWKDQTPEALIELDTLLTLAFINYTYDIGGGRSRFTTNAPSAFKEKKMAAYDALALIKTALSAPDLNLFMNNLLPTHKYYKNLRTVLPLYQEMAATGGWPSIASGRSIHPGENDARIPTIKSRLQIEGFLQAAPTATDTTTYDELLAQAVIKFQLRHGLTGDGVIGTATIAAMNVTAQQKVRQILVNLERWRGKDHDLGKKYVLIDIAGFHLEGITDDQVILDMPVIVGTILNQTPIFSDRIQYMEINPFWNIPPSIARNEMLEEVKKDNNFLNSSNIRLFSDWSNEASEINPLCIDWNKINPQQMSHFKLRQEPGKKNALGSIKFIFPNSHSVYMHDTPSQANFKHAKRAFSHGCIRLEQPVKLADFLMNKHNDWTQDRFHEIINSGKRTIVHLPEPPPVHITYQTVKSDQQGLASFHPDIYDQDRQLEQILFEEQDVYQRTTLQ